MDPFTIARDMALGLAAGHWAATVDMLDVEYVIGSRPHVQSIEIRPLSRADTKALKERSSRRVRNMSAVVATPQEKRSFRNHPIQLWMFHFNKTKLFDASVEEDKYWKNITQLVNNTRATNGPYYPRVLARYEDEWKLWLELARAYIHASKTILSDSLDLMRDAGMIPLAKHEELVMKRPSHVINEWMKAEATENKVTSKQFWKKLKDNNWETP